MHYRTTPSAEGAALASARLPALPGLTLAAERPALVFARYTEGLAIASA